MDKIAATREARLKIEKRRADSLLGIGDSAMPVDMGKGATTELANKADIKGDVTVPAIATAVKEQIENGGYQPTNIKTTEYQNGVVIFKWVTARTNERGETEYYFSMRFEAPGNIAFPPENRFFVKNALIGTDERVAKNICYNPYVSPIYMTDYDAGQVLAVATEEVEKDYVREKFPTPKLNALAVTMDEILEGIDPTERKYFIEGLQALSHLYGTPAELKQVAQIMVQLVTQNLTGEQYPSVLYSSFAYTSSYITNLSDLEAIGKIMAQSGWWRTFGSYFVEAYLRGTMVKTNDKFRSPPMVMHKYRGRLHHFEPIVDLMVEDVPVAQRDAFLAALIENQGVINVESLITEARKCGLTIDGSDQEVLKGYQSRLKEEGSNNLQLNQAEPSQSPLYVWARSQLGLSDAGIIKAFDLSDPAKPILRRDVLIGLKPIKFPDNLTIQGTVRLDNHYGPMAFAPGMEVTGDIYLYASSFTDNKPLPQDLKVGGTVILHHPRGNYEQLIAECDRLGLKYIVKRDS